VASTKTKFLSIQSWITGLEVRICIIGGEGGIRTHGSDINRNNRLAGDPDQPLQHLSAVLLMAMLFYHFLDYNQN
jgi:hypothetical protein